MDKVKIQFSIAQEDAIRAGNHQYGTVEYWPTDEELGSLTNEEREELIEAQRLTSRRIDEVRTVSGELRYVAHRLVATTWDTVRAILSMARAERKNLVRKREEEQRRYEQRERERAAEWAKKPVGERVMKLGRWTVRNSEEAQNWEPAAFAEAIAEVARRNKVDDDCAKAEEERKAEAARALTKAIEDWLWAHGEANELRSRYVDDLLPEAELWRAISDDVFSALDGVDRYERIDDGDVHDEPCDKEYLFDDAEELDAERYTKLREIRKLAPVGAIVTPRRHKGWCQCEGVYAIERFGARVTVDWHGRKLSREYAL